MTKPKRQQHQTIPPGAKCFFCPSAATKWHERIMGGEFDYYVCPSHKDSIAIKYDPWAILSRPLVAR